MGNIADNLARVRGELAAACVRAGRDAADVRLMAVSKTHPAAAIVEAYAAGQRLFGENRVQEAQGKMPELAALDGVEMHLIGPLQSNKSAKAAETFSAVQTVDSAKIAQRLDAACAALGNRLPVWIEVKLSHEESKHGLAPTELAALLEAVGACGSLEPQGLMTVPPYTDDPEGARPYFARLRALRDEFVAKVPTLTGLSMGMSHDFAVAIEEGSTMVRVGTAIFGKREYPAAG